MSLNVRSEIYIGREFQEQIDRSNKRNRHIERFSNKVRSIYEKQFRGIKRVKLLANSLNHIHYLLSRVASQQNRGARCVQRQQAQASGRDDSESSFATAQE